MINILNRILREFLRNCSIHGLRPLLLFVECRYAKKLWILFMILTIIYTHHIIVKMSIAYLEAPTEVRMSTNVVHVANSPFVGVALCSANKFSRRKLRLFAKKAFEIQENYHPGLLAHNATQMMEFLLALAGFYVYPYDDYETGDLRLEKLHQILTIMYNGSDYSSPDILLALAPDCENIVLRIMLFGKLVNTRDYIRKDMTTSSVCCMFNYKRKSYAMNKEPSTSMKHNDIKFETNSLLSSVQIVMQDDPDDFIFRDSSSDAFQVFLFASEDYAKVQSQAIGEITASYNNIVLVPVQPVFMGSRYTIKQFAPHVRHCYYAEEGQQLLNQSFYSVDECLLICRMRSMVNHCGCVNPSLPAELIDATFCNLLDLPCLTEWKKIWYGWNYFGYVETYEDKLQLLSRSTDTQRCDLCYPQCDGVDFKTYVNKLPMVKASHNHIYKHGLLQNITDTKPLSIIKLFFMNRYAVATEKDLSENWMVLLSRFGGIMSLMYGFGIMSYIEVLYYLTGKWFMLISKAAKLKSKTDSLPSNTVRVLEKLNSNQEVNANLYWHEIQPKCFTDPLMLQKPTILSNYNKNVLLKVDL